jgi:hypothetical protein
MDGILMRVVAPAGDFIGDVVEQDDSVKKENHHKKQ